MPPDDSFRGRAGDQYQPCLSIYQQTPESPPTRAQSPRPPSNRTYPAHARCRHRSLRNSARHRLSGTILWHPSVPDSPATNHPAGWWSQANEAPGPCRRRSMPRRGMAPRSTDRAQRSPCSTVALRAVQPSMCGRIRRPQPHRRHRSHRPRSCECAAGSGSSPPCARGADRQAVWN